MQTILALPTTLDQAHGPREPIQDPCDQEATDQISMVTFQDPVGELATRHTGTIRLTLTDGKSTQEKQRKEERCVALLFLFNITVNVLSDERIKKCKSSIYRWDGHIDQHGNLL